LNKKQSDILYFLSTQNKSKSPSQISNKTNIKIFDIEKELHVLAANELVEIRISPSGKKIREASITEQGASLFTESIQFNNTNDVQSQINDLKELVNALQEAVDAIDNKDTKSGQNALEKINTLQSVVNGIPGAAKVIGELLKLI
jgi:DNA-binding MarR family transcriptional regulator